MKNTSTPPYSPRWNLPTYIRWLALISAVVLLILLAFSSYSYTQLSTQSQADTRDTSFMMRQISQIQREILRYTVVLDAPLTSIDSDSIKLHTDLIESRFLITLRHNRFKILSPSIRDELQQMYTTWQSIKEICLTCSDANTNAQRQQEQLESVQALELELNNLMTAFTLLYHSEIDRNLEQIDTILTALEVVGVLFLVLCGLSVVSILRFLQQQRAADVAIQLSREHYERAASAGRVTVWSWDIEADGILFDGAADWIPTGEKGVKSHQFLKQFVNMGDQLKGKQQMVNLLKGNIDIYEEEHQFQLADGNTIWGMVRARVDRREDGRAVRVSGTLTDITKRKETEEAALQTQHLESLGVLVGGIAHDFNNLLTSMMGQQSVALRKAGANSPLRKHLERAQDASKRAANLTRQLLDYAGEGHRIVETFDLNSYIRDNSALLRTFVTKQVAIDFNLASNSLMLDGDKSQIQQVLMNLVINGAEAIPATGAVTVTTEPITLSADALEHAQHFIGHPPVPGHYIRFAVEDTGSGMDAMTLQKVFDPFFTTKTNGRGLGLSATVGIIKSHSGALQVISQLGEGTCFTIYLPISAEHPLLVAADTLTPHVPTPRVAYKSGRALLS